MTALYRSIFQSIFSWYHLPFGFIIPSFSSLFKSFHAFALGNPPYIFGKSDNSIIGAFSVGGRAYRINIVPNPNDVEYTEFYDENAGEYFYNYAVADNSLLYICEKNVHKLFPLTAPDMEVYNGKLKTHSGEILFYIDSETFEETNSFETKKRERILFADNDIILTYYNGKYRTYDANTKKVIKKQSAKEIKNNGSYTFETCGDYVFVFDAESGDLLNAIPIDVD